MKEKEDEQMKEESEHDLSISRSRESTGAE